MRAILLAALLTFVSIRAASANDAVWIVGHKSPDTDAIVSAISVSTLKNALGIKAIPKAQGSPNPETDYLLKRFGVAAPTVQTSFEGQKVILVDHGEYAQAPDDIRQASIIGIIDHHRLGGIETADPIEVIIKPYGCTNTIIYELFVQNNIEIDPPLAGLMLGAILDDTLVFRSPTTTNRDREVAQSLAKLAGIANVEEFGRGLLKVNNEKMVTMDDRSLLGLDVKSFEFGVSKVTVAQVEAFDTSFLQPRIQGLRDQMSQIIAGDGIDAFILVLTDIDKQGSFIITEGKRSDLVHSAFGIKHEPIAGSWQDGVMSRKKQIIPQLEKSFSQSAPPLKLPQP